MSEDQNRESDAGTARSFDPERGAFAPPPHPPLLNRETNPRGTRHIDETAPPHGSHRPSPLPSRPGPPRAGDCRRDPSPQKDRQARDTVVALCPG